MKVIIVILYHFCKILNTVEEIKSYLYQMSKKGENGLKIQNNRFRAQSYSDNNVGEGKIMEKVK